MAVCIQDCLRKVEKVELGGTKGRKRDVAYKELVYRTVLVSEEAICFRVPD